MSYSGLLYCPPFKGGEGDRKGHHHAKSEGIKKATYNQAGD
jgi:hypothetical protein